MGVREFPDQPGFAHARLAYQRHDLAVADSRVLECLTQNFQFRLPADESGQPSCGGRLHSRA